MPFTLHECEQYMKAKKIQASHYDLLEYYMVFGGVPFYWSLLTRGQSVAQNVDKLIFAEDGKLRYEFNELYDSLFRNPEKYVRIVMELGKNGSGMTRDELVKQCELEENGRTSRMLEDLEECGFIRKIPTYGLKNQATFRLIDNYTLFYFQFVQGYAGHDEHRWTNMVHDQRRRTWEGLSFERVCLQHSRQIKAALGISGVETSESSWRCVSDDPDVRGAQIDLVIERGDRVVNLCEIKFASEKFAIDADYAVRLREKVGAFKRETGTRDNCHLTFVTTYGLRRNSHCGIVQSEVTLDDLFRE
jgi:hypothetical protein